MAAKNYKNMFNQQVFNAATHATGGDPLAGLFASIGLPTYVSNPGGGFNVMMPQDFMPNKPNGNGKNTKPEEEQYPLNQIPNWWNEWNKNYGRFGTMPPVQGLL